HADQAVVADGAAMQQRAMADRTALADGEREAWVRVHDRVFLHIRVFANHDRFIVATDDGTEPDADIATDMDIADERHIRGKPVCVLVLEPGLCCIDCVDGHIYSCQTGTVAAAVSLRSLYHNSPPSHLRSRCC